MLTYWKTTITVQVLTAGEQPPDYASLRAVADDIDTGEASGLTETATESVDEDEMRRLLTAQGSDPSFLIPDDESGVRAFESGGGPDLLCERHADAYGYEWARGGPTDGVLVCDRCSAGEESA